ncbi:hypothetical protein L5515_006795 [Caenorhabditis briggsae]|uniref:G protein-coupled receptor n=1 Tax=Caenorhabditis briggsae TaxID=6238 RepID=A0AAE9JJX6_CAEBR|nr:hypothetical protein L5515_006795 [Caenorhabditis briggsae]
MVHALWFSRYICLLCMSYGIMDVGGLEEMSPTDSYYDKQLQVCEFFFYGDYERKSYVHDSFKGLYHEDSLNMTMVVALYWEGSNDAVVRSWIGVVIVTTNVTCMHFSGLDEDEELELVRTKYRTYEKQFLEVYDSLAVYDINVWWIALLSITVFGSAYCVPFYILSTYSMHKILADLSRNLSRINQKKQKMALISLVVQLIVLATAILPVGLLAILLMIEFNYAQIATRIELMVYCFHSTANAIALILTTPPFRRFTFFWTVKRKKNYYTLNHLILVLVMISHIDFTAPSWFTYRSYEQQFLAVGYSLAVYDVNVWWLGVLSIVFIGVLLVVLATAILPCGLLVFFLLIEFEYAQTATRIELMVYCFHSTANAIALILTTPPFRRFTFFWTVK